MEQAPVDLSRFLPTVDDGAILERLNVRLSQRAIAADPDKQAWLAECLEQKRAWQAFKRERFDTPALM